jgi:AraC-like DNA-binding protein
LLAERGIDAARLLAEVGIAARVFDNPENRMWHADLGRLLAACVEATGCDHFGLLVGQRFDPSALGLLGDLLCNAPTLRDALRMAASHLDVHDRGAVSLTLDVGERLCALGYSLIEWDVPAAEQILDGAIAMQFVLLSRLGGRNWKPVRVQLSHSRPARIAPLKSFFGAPLEFDASLSAIVFDARWLDHRVESADAKAFSVVVATLESDPAWPAASFAAQVRGALHAMMLTASASSANVARLFGLHERTLRRRLHAEGATVRGLVNDVRREFAHHLLRDTNLTVSGVAAALCYSDATVFARAFRAWSTLSPHEWRTRHCRTTKAAGRAGPASARGQREHRGEDRDGVRRGPRP